MTKYKLVIVADVSVPERLVGGETVKFEPKKVEKGLKADYKQFLPEDLDSFLPFGTKVSKINVTFDVA